MTREEAIICLQGLLDNPLINKGSYLAQAIEMAIQALSQEPCDKCEVGNPCLYCKHEFSQKIEPCDDAVSRADFEAHLFENYCVPVSKIGKPNQYSSGCFYKDVVKCLDELLSFTQSKDAGK